MSGVLASAVSEFLQKLPSERHFDAPLLALLRLIGFSDIHFIHGPFEFGKDFIAKRTDDATVVQYAFQSKLGDISRAQWTQELQPQCETMAISRIAHPSFDRSLARRNILILTGRLKGQTGVLAQEYCQSLPARGLPQLDIWDHESLVELLSASECLGMNFDWPAFGHFIHASSAECTPLGLAEVYAQRWILRNTEQDLWRASLEYALVRDELDHRHLGFHSFRLALGLIRSAVVFSEHSPDIDPHAATLIELIRRETAHRARAIIDWVLNLEDDRLKRELAAEPPYGLVIFSIHEFLLLDIVSLYVLSQPSITPEDRDRCARFFSRLLAFDAAARPISDDFAVSVLTTAVAASVCGLDVDQWLIRVTDWIREAHAGDNPTGLAAPRSTPTSELWRILGSIVDNPSVPSRRETVLGAAVLDACSVLCREDAYVSCHRLLVQNDLIVPERTLPKSDDRQFQTGHSGAIHVLGGEYPSTWQGRDGWKNAPSHDFADLPRQFNRRGQHWLGVALSLLLRDRWWLHSYRVLWVRARNC